MSSIIRFQILVFSFSSSIWQLCQVSFYPQDLESCDAFKHPRINLLNQRCFTFNGNGENLKANSEMVTKMSGGLNVMFSFEQPINEYADSRHMKLFVHEPHEYPDVNNRKYTSIFPGFIAGYQVPMITYSIDGSQKYSEISQ